MEQKLIIITGFLLAPLKGFELYFDLKKRDLVINSFLKFSEKSERWRIFDFKNRKEVNVPK